MGLRIKCEIKVGYESPDGYKLITFQKVLAARPFIGDNIDGTAELAGDGIEYKGFLEVHSITLYEKYVLVRMVDIILV